MLVWLYLDSLEIENFNDKYVFVTGCDSGFGNLLCKRLDRKGFRVLAGCLTEKGADDLKRVAGPYLKTVLLDVTSQDSIQKAMEWTKKEVGERDIKVQRLIMNAVCDSDLAKVTNCMEHALTSAYPRTRYSAGWDAKLIWIPLSYMPSWVVDVGLKLVLPRPLKSV
uniref:Retinol dehydrogenase 5 (11-cis/9-cis) n=1 Tax=Myripristis murdjan TaxID=586833 RepID=A0A667ZXF6_9TELE